MGFISAKEAARIWGVSDRQVQRLLSEGRIAGAKKYGASWMVPCDAKKPLDPRKARKLPKEARPEYVFFAYADLPKNDPDAALQKIDEALRPLAAADIAFRRGDPEPAKRVWRDTGRGDKTKLSAASLAAVAAISSGDYALYDEIRLFLQARIAAAESEGDRALLSLPEALAAVSMAAQGMTPDWLKNGDFSLFPHELRPFLLYLHALHLRNTGKYAEMLGVAKATLALAQKPASFTWLDVYLYVLCAGAAYALGETAASKSYLDAAIALGLPCGLIAPFADHLGEFGGLLEAAIGREYRQYGKPISDLWNSSFKNWMRFHNAFAKDNITTLLSAQEYQTALLITHGETYAGAARRMNLSVSRVRHILADVYAKLYIQGKQELSSFIL